MSDEWRTPQWLFDELNQEFNFDIDLCATAENSKCNWYCDDYLSDCVSHIVFNHSYLGFPLNLIEEIDIKTCFMNPPYSNPKPFIEKAWEDSKHCRIVCLVKCDPSTRWWATFWNYENISTIRRCIQCNGSGKGILSNGKQLDACFYCSSTGSYIESLEERGPKLGCEVRFFPKRIQFDPPQQLIDSGEVWYLESDCRRGYTKGKWVWKCDNIITDPGYRGHHRDCAKCKGKGYTGLSGPSFSCALVIMNRRGI